jgi:multidrug efflux pump
VDFSDRLQAEGKERYQAIIDAAALRLRLILMTTAAMILGSVPLAAAVGAGAESRQQIGWVIVGGMSLGTVLTLFVVPCIYAVMGYRPLAKTAPAAAPAPAE